MKHYSEDHYHFMKIALEEARKAYQIGEVPVGAIVVHNSRVISKAHNRVEEFNSVLEHAEMIAIREASAILQNKYLEGCTLYVTLEPCVMCAGAIIASRIQRVVYGADEPKSGCAGSILNLLHFPGFHHFVHITPNILEDESSALLRQFFQDKRL